MQKILFLDDDPERQFHFARMFPDAQIVTTAQEAIERLEAHLRNDLRYELVFLDHDLNGEVYVDSQRTDCGMEVVRFLRSQPLQGFRVIVHTRNSQASITMQSELQDHGYQVKAAPFGSREFDSVVLPVLRPPA